MHSVVLFSLLQYLLPWLSVSHLLRWVMWFPYSSVCQLAEAYARENASCVAVCQSWLEAFPVFFCYPLSLLSLVGKEIQRCMNLPAIIPLDIWSSHVYRYILFFWVHGFGGFCFVLFFSCVNRFFSKLFLGPWGKGLNSTLYSPPPEGQWEIMIFQ